MSQHDYNIANGTFPAVRTDINNALSAIQTTNSGTSRPTGAVAGQLWLDTTSATTPTLKYYDGADDISLATIDHTANTVNWLDSTVSITGLSTTATGTVLTLSDTASTTTVNLIIDNQKELRFEELNANGNNYVALKSPASLTADYTFTLPSSYGSSGQALVTDGAGGLSWGSSGFSGATENAISSSAITLTSSSTQYQKVQINSTTNNYVTLPSATTMGTEGTSVFVIENASPIGTGLDIKNNGGNIIGTIPNAYTAFISLVDNSTTNGTWKISAVLDQAVIDISPTVNTNTPTNTTLTKVIHLTSTKLLVANFYATSTTVLTMYTKIGDLSGNTITFGSQQSTTLTIGSADITYWRADIVRLSDSAFILFWGSANASGGASIKRVSANTVSGTTITFGTQNGLSFPTGASDGTQTQATVYNGLLCRMSDTKFAVVYNTTTVVGGTYWQMCYSGSLTCNIITVSGTTLTVGTKVDLGTSTYTQPTTLVCHDTDRLCVVYYQHTSSTNGTGRTKVNIISVSGTTPTWGTSVNVESADIASVWDNLFYWIAPTNGTCSLNNIFGVALSTTSVVGIGGGTGSAVTGYILISISGTTPSIVATKAFDYAQTYNALLHINSSTLFIPHVIGNGGRYLYVSSAGFRISNYTVNSANSPYIAGNYSYATIRATSASTSFTTYNSGVSPNYIVNGTFIV